MRRALGVSAVVLSFLGGALASRAQEAEKPVGPPAFVFEAVQVKVEYSAKGAPKDDLAAALTIAMSGMPMTMWRAKVPSGWVVSMGKESFFVHDPEHRWDGGTVR